MEEKPALREWEPSDLDFVSTSNFSLQCSIGSHTANAKFEWVDYRPAVFRKLQEFGEIDNDDYTDSIRGHETLKFLISPEKATSLCLQHDDRFIIKILSKSEMKVLLEILPKYFHHLKKYRRSLLPKFYGLYVVKPQGGKKVVRFVVVGNILRSDISIHKKFNLGISPQGRLVSKAGAEEDLNVAFHLHAAVRHQLLRQIKHDCSFLKEVGVTEYSLLLGMHVCSAPFEAVFQGHYTTTHKEGSDDTEKKTSDGPDGTQCDPAEDMTTDDNSGLSCPIEFESELGIRMTARAVNTHRKEGNLASLCHPRKRPPDNVILHLGIVNILQGHSKLKHVEHVFRSLQSDSPMILAVNPKVYSTHFEEFLCKIFPESEAEKIMKEL
ncbi:unnamed protein product [Musa textilis]